MSATAPAVTETREDLIRVYRWLRHYGLNDSHSGNVSVRGAATVWITPSGCCADTLTAGDLVASTPDESPPPGASLDAPLHLAVYRQMPETGCVIHSHGPYVIAMTLTGDDFVPPDFEGQYYFRQVPVLDIPFDRYIADSPERVALALVDTAVVVVRGHGIYARGATLDEAYKWTCSLEASARIAWLRDVLHNKDS